MFRFLRNKLLATFMIIGAMTQVSQAKENQVDKVQPVAQESQKKAGPWASDEEFLRDFTETAIQSAYEIELPSLHGIAVQKVELQRTISFEFANRYQEAAEKSLITGDKSYLKKIYEERDEILAQRQKAWDDGTFDKLAEAKRWAEYLKQRAIDQTLVNYPIEVGQPPFPIDMSILTSEEKDPAPDLKVAESVSTIPNENITYKTAKDEVEELLRELDQETTVPLASSFSNDEVEPITPHSTSPALDTVASVPVNENHNIAAVDTELDDLLNSVGSNKIHTPPRQKDLEDLLADLEKEEQEHSIAATAPIVESVNSETVVAQTDTVSLTPTNTIVNVVAANDMTAQTNSVMPDMEVAGKIFPTEKEDNEFKEMLKHLDEEIAGKIHAGLDPASAPADEILNPSILEVKETLQDLDAMLAENSAAQSIETTSDVSKDERADLNVTIAEKTALTDTAKIVEKEEEQGQKELNELIAYADKAQNEEITPSDQSVTEENVPVVVKSEMPERSTVQNATTDTVQNPAQETIEKTVVAAAEKSEPVSTPQDVEKRNENVQADLTELLALIESEYPTPQKPKDNGSTMPWEKIAIISLGVLAAGALKRPKQDKWKGLKKWGYVPKSEIYGASCDKLEQLDEEGVPDKTTENTVADTTPVNVDIQSKPAENNVPANPIPANMQIRAIQHEENLTPEERNFLAERLHAVRLMEDIKHKRYKLTRQMAKAKANNDTEQIKTIEAYRSALKALRKEAFEAAAGPLLGQIKEERRLLTKKMTIARRRKDAAIMAEITKRRAFLKIQEEVLKTTVREFKYKQERATFLKPTLVQKMTPGIWKKRTTQHTRV